LLEACHALLHSLLLLLQALTKLVIALLLLHPE
jgi:hypothetical protein